MKDQLRSVITSVWFIFALVSLGIVTINLQSTRVNDIFRFTGSTLVIAWTCWQASFLIYRKICVNLRIMTSVDPKGKSVIITGCDSGFGHQLAQQLAAKGFTVYALCLHPGSRDVSHLRESSPRILVYGMDVTDDIQVTSVSKQIVRQIEEKGERAWALVNNAGILTSGEIEWVSMEHFKAIMDINTFGMVRVTRAFLPVLRSHQGRIVNMASVARRFVAPGVVAYGMTKSAVSAFTEGLRREMYKWNVPVIQIEPDAYRTPMTGSDRMLGQLKEFWNNTPEDIKSAYGDKYFTRFYQYISQNLKSARNHPQEVINSLLDAILSDKPESNYLCCGYHNRIIIFLFDILPSQWLELIVRPFFVNQAPAQRQQDFSKHCS